MRLRCRLTLALVCLVIGVGRTSAQDPAVDPYDAARFHFGPLGVTPSIVISDVGRDENVFNEAVNPKGDTTAAIGPAAQLALRMGRSRLSGRASGQYVYFHRYDNQRSWNTTLDGTWRFPLARITPFVLGTRVQTRERPGYEIDARARRADRTVGLGTDLRLSSKTTLVLSGRRTWVRYDDREQFLGIDLAQRLNRQSDSEQLDARFILTPLTTFVVRTQAMQDRFDQSPLRDSNSYSVVPGFELRPEALISGQVFVGVRRFTTLSDAVPDYTGLVAQVKARYVLRATRFAASIGRDVAYSFEEIQPFYTLTDAGLEVTQRITGAWDLVARGSRQTLGYRSVASAVSASERVDHGRMLGGGIGYRVGRTLRVGVDVNHYQRTDDRDGGRSYRGLRVGGSVSYGLPQ